MPEAFQPWKSLCARTIATPTRPYGRSGPFTQVRKLCSTSCKSFLIATLLAVVMGGPTAQPMHAAGTDQALALDAQRVVDELRAQLGITAEVSVRIVDHDPRVVSVRGRRDGSGGFALWVERRFVQGASAEQRVAALAHELGHVWIATHHPYLQTEQLANRIAMRVVTREQLVSVYQALWGAEALHGNLETFLGVQAKAEQ